MAGYKSLQVAEALSRVSQQLQPQITRGSLENSVYSQNTNTLTPLGETNRQIEQANQYYNTLYSKTGSDYVQDAAVALGKGIVAVPQAIAGLADLGDAALSAVGTTLSGGSPADIQTGRVTKTLDDAGLRFKETQDIMNGWYSEGTQKQLQQLAALPGMSTEQSFGENMSSLGQTAGYVLDNPSIALNTIIQSLPAMGAGGAIGRVAGAVAPKVAGAAGAIGEGTIMAGTAQANMDTDEQGYTTAAQSLGALGIGVLGGAVGQLGNRIANRAGADDIDSLAAGVPTQMPKQGFTSLAVGTVTEAAEEAAQSSLENVIANITSGKDAIEGLNQDLVLGTFAGAGMGAAANAGGSLKSAALEAVMTAAQNQANKIKERVQRAAPEKSDLPTEELANPASEKYNPTAAIIRESKGITPEATEEEIQAVKTNMNKVLTDAETHLAGLVERRDLLKGEEVLLKNIEGAKAAVQTFAETEPERAAKAQDVLDNILLPKLEMLNETKAKTTIEGLEAVIGETEKKVTEARDMHTKMDANIQATQDTLANMTPAQKIFAAPTAYSVEEIEAAIQSPDTAPELQQSLRVLADAIVAQNAVKSIDEVNNQIVGKKFDPNYRSTPQYMEQFSAAIRNGSIPTQRNLMREIEAFEQSHVQKAQLVQAGLEQAQQIGKPVQIIRSAAGSWEVNNAEFLKGDAAKKNGTITIHPTPKGIAAMVKTNEYMQAEAAAITATKAAMQAMTQLSTPNQATQQQAAPTFNPTQPMDFTSDDPFQAALDGYNQDMRSTNEWQPNSRSIDPRTTGVLEDTVNPTTGETVIPTEVQPTSGSAPTTNQPTGTPTATQDLDELKPDLSNTEIQFDESGVGSVIPTSGSTLSVEYSDDVPVTVTSNSTMTEAQRSTLSQNTAKALREAQLEVHPNHPNKDIFHDGKFGTGEQLEIDKQGNVVLLRKAKNEQHLSKNWAESDIADMEATSLSNGGGKGLPTSGVASWNNQFGSKDHTLAATFVISPEELVQAVKDGNAFVGNTAEGEIVLNPVWAKNYLSTVNGEAVSVNDKGDVVYSSTGKSIDAVEEDAVTSDGLPSSISIGEVKAKPSVTKEMAEATLEGKYSEDTHAVYQKDDGNWSVRKRDLQAELDAMNLELDNNVQAFEEVTVDEDGEASAMVSEADADEKVTEVSARDTERAKPINERNLVIDGFNRKQVPLVAVPNLHQYLDNPKRIKAVITKLTKVQPEQQHIDNVEQFMRFRNAFANHINGSVKVRRNTKPDHAKYNWQDYLQFLVQDDGKFDDATITALAATAYTWVAENGEVTTKTEKDVAKLLRLRNVESVPPHVYEAMAQLGDLRNVTITSLGQRTSQALGYKLVTDVSELRKAKLEAALGSLVLKGLEGLNLVEITPVAAQDYANWKAEVEDANPGSRAGSQKGLSDDYVYNFVRIANKDNEPTKGVKKIVEANKKTNGVINKLFEVKSTFTMPLTEPPKEVKSSFNDAGTPIPSEAEETIKASQVRPYGFITPMVKVADVLRELDAVEFKRMLGFKTENEIADMQVMKQKGQQSVNESIERSLDIFDSFRGDLNNSGLGERADFYMPQFLVSNTRSHYDSDLTPQMDKIHRGLVGMKEHEVELDVSQELFTDKGITEMGRFIQALAMNMEEAPIYQNPLNNKYVTIDKANYKNFIPAFMAYIETPLVRNAITAMQNVQSGKASHKDLTHIQQAVAEFGMNMQSLRALQALADFDTARKYAAQGSSSKFRTDLTFESDGVTNGPFLTGISTNTLADNARNAGGLFRDDKLTSVPEYKEGLGQDLYEFLGEAMKTAWTKVKAGVIEGNKKMAIQAVKSLDTLYPAFGGRSGAKPITTTANYGAGDNSIKAANAREVINNLINKLDTNHISEALPFINAANDIIKYIDVIAKFKAKEEGKPHVAIPLIPTNVNPKQIKLEPTQIKTLFDYSKKMHGDAIEQALQIGMGDFIPVRNSLTNHASLAFEFFDVLRTDALEAATQRAIQEKTLETVNGKPIESISVKEKNRALREIAKYTPTFTNAMASVSSNKAQSSTPLMKTDLTWEESYQATSELHFNKASMKVHAHLMAPANPGVSGLALAIQSMDSFVTHFVMKRMASQNYHDANAGSIKEATKMAQLQNEAVFTALRTMHLSSGMVKAFLRSGNGAFDLGSLTTDGTIPSSIEEVLRKMVNAKKDQHLNEFDLASEIQQQVMSSFDRDIAKLRELAKEKYVGQYGTQEGHYTVTNADLKAIEKEVNKLKADRIRQLEEAGRLGKALNQMTGYKKPAKSAESIEAIMKGGIEFKYLKGTLQKELSQYTGESNTRAQQYSVLFKELLKMFNTAIPDDLVLKGISVNSPDADNIPNIEQVRENRISAWFGKDAKGKDAIFFAQEAGMPTAKVVVHELLHAATVNAIAQFRANPDKYPEGKVALDRVEKLFNNVKNKVAKDKDANDIVKYGVSNLEEFIATGLTYPEFVDYLAKTQVQSGSRSKLNFTDGFAEFIKSVADVLSTFVKSKVFQSGRMISALEALVYDTTDLIQNSVNMQNDLVPAPVQIDIFGAPQQARASVEGYTSRQVFDALNSNLNPQFKTHLTTMMTHVSDQILGNTLLSNNNGAWTMEQAWQEYIDAGKTETTETAVTAGFRMTEQETFAVESLFASIKAGIKDKAMTQVYAEMDKAYKSAKAKMKVEDFYEGDWATATKDDRETAQDKYDFLFKLGSQNPEHLSRFVAMALGSEYVNGKLGFAIKDTTARPDNVFQRLVEGTNDLVNYVSGLMTNSSVAGTVNSKLSLLSQELAQIDSKHRNFAVSKVEQQIEKISDMADNVSNKLRDKVTELAEKDAVANSRFTAVRFASHTTRLAAKGDLWTTLDVLKEASSYENPNQRLGFLGEVVNEAANNDSTKDNFEYLMRLTKLNNQMKENLRDATTKNVMSTFEENGAYLTKEDKHSLTNFLRIDTQSLLDNYSVSDIAKMYSNGQYLHSQIRNLESQVTGKDVPVTITRAKQLAKYMVTGKPSPGLAPNAQLIVSGFNSGEVVDLSDPNVSLIDQIATLYAIEYTNIKDKARLNSIFKRELKNGTNGIDTSLKFHRELSQVARENLFADNAVSMIKGFVPEITNPNREVRIANNDVEAKLYKDQFYKEVKSLTKDKRDPSSHNPRLFLTEEANIQRLVSGAVEVVSTNRKGTSVLLNHKERANITQSIAKSFPTSPNYNPMHDPDVAMRPNYDTQGNVIGYSYEMSAEHRDSYLERNNDFSELLGAYAATNFNKQKVPEQNAKVIDALYEDYSTNFKENPRAYVNVGPNSQDPGLREMWAMLPQATRDHVRNTFAAEQVYGQGGMMIRQDLLLMIFGYRKYSLNQSFDKMNEARNMFEKLYVGIMKTLFEDNAKVRGVQIERSWQEAVRLLKDIIVIRNVKTMLFNTMSNGMLLMAHGISPTDIVRDSLTAVRAGTQYRKDMANLIAIRQKQRAGVGNFNQLEQEALKLEDSINRNPLKGFIEEGMMPTIVEDVDPEMDHYSYKTKMQEKIEGYTSQVPKSVRTAAKWAFVSPDTPIYQFLNNATQFSDFSAKYTMYRYYTEKAKDKLEHKAALQIASDNFINYDVPTAKGLQYLNDMGVVMFTKYNIRIQKALFQLLKKRPATAMAQALFINSFTNLESGIDPLIWFNLGNPLREGAFGLPSALDEPFPIKILSGM